RTNRRYADRRPPVGHSLAAAGVLAPSHQRLFAAPIRWRRECTFPTAYPLRFSFNPVSAATGATATPARAAAWLKTMPLLPVTVTYRSNFSLMSFGMHPMPPVPPARRHPPGAIAACLSPAPLLPRP